MTNRSIRRKRQYRSGGGVSANARKQEALRAMIATRKRNAAKRKAAEKAEQAAEAENGAGVDSLADKTEARNGD